MSAQVQIASPNRLGYDKFMQPLRSKSLALGMAPLLWAGLLLQSGAWACGCLEHNPWLLTIAHCVAELDHHDHPAKLVVAHTEQELDHHHIPSRDVYLSDAQVVNPPQEVDVEFLPWHLVESPSVPTCGDSAAWPHAPPEHSLTSGPLRAQIQVYLL